MLKAKKNNGFTLIEVIISIAIIGVLLLIFLGYFSEGAINIFLAGKRTDNVFEAQDKIDNTIKNTDSAVDNEGVEVKEPTNLSIKFQSADGEIINASSFKGKIITVTIEDTITITTYVSE